MIWLDEEPPSDIYAECLLRTTATAGFGGGILMATFTPLQGLTELVETFLPGGTVAEFSPDAPGAKYVVMASWDDVPHLSADEKAALLAAMPPHQRAARTQGIPYLGAGVIYPVEESDITVQDFALPAYWPRGYGMDVGWNRTAAVWGAYDRSADTLYLYSMHYRGEAEPPIHAEAVKARGALLPGRIDPASRGRSQSDGQQLLQQYRRLGLRLETAPNAVEAGIYEVWTRLSTGRLRVFASLQAWFEEFRVYRRDEKGRIVKARDHGLDACVTGDTRVVTSEGLRPIASLVGRAGWARTRGGAWARFTSARLVECQVPVVRLSFTDGAVVRCTPDHQFLTASGWIRADRMRGRACYDAVTQCIQRSQWSSRLRQRFRSIATSAFICAASIFSGMAGGFIAWCSPMRPDNRFRPAGPSIIKTATGRTTASRISCCCLGDCTRRSIIAAATSAAFQLKPWKPLGPGTARSEEQPGIAPIMRQWARSSTSGFGGPATGAGAAMREWRGDAIASARMPVRRNPVSRLAWTIRNGVAWCVAECSWRIATCRHVAAREAAGVVCLDVRNAGLADVYCLTVPGPSAFAIETGLVVHNTRYLCASGVATKPAWSWLQTLVPQPKPQPRRTAFVGRRQQHTAASLGWMK